MQLAQIVFGKTTLEKLMEAARNRNLFELKLLKAIASLQPIFATKPAIDLFEQLAGGVGVEQIPSGKTLRPTRFIGDMRGRYFRLGISRSGPTYVIALR